MKNLDLVKEYPDLFEDMDKPTTESLMSFGCQCGDGWHDLLDETFEKISGSGFKLFQVKEKLGALVIYLAKWKTVPKHIAMAIEDAHAKSLTICEICGESGTLCLKQGGSFVLQTLCKAHQQELGYRPTKY